MEVNFDAVPSGASRKCNPRQWGEHTVTFDGQNLALSRYKLRALSQNGRLGLLPSLLQSLSDQPPGAGAST